MEDSSTGNQANTQGGSEYSSGIDTASSGQLESASITSEILLANRGSSSAGSSDIRVVRLLNFDTLADAADALALVAARTTAQGTTITTTQGSPAKGRFTITATTDHTVNEEDVRRKRPRPPETTTTTNPFSVRSIKCLISSSYNLYDDVNGIYSVPFCQKRLSVKHSRLLSALVEMFCFKYVGGATTRRFPHTFNTG